MGPVTYLPAGTKTVPPPAARAASIADRKASVEGPEPSLRAPQSTTLYVRPALQVGMPATNRNVISSLFIAILRKRPLYVGGQAERGVPAGAASAENSNSTANCKMRGSAAAVSAPNVADVIFILAPTVPAPDVPNPRFVWLMTLNASARACRVNFSCSLNLRERETSKLNVPGPRNESRPRLP